MNTLQVFVAGSKDLVEERRSIKIIANNLQIDYQKRNQKINVQVYSFENFSHQFAENGQQYNYNKFIQEHADLVLFVFDKQIGHISMEEFEVAYFSYMKNKHPNIIAYFKKNKGKDTEQIATLKRCIDFIGQYYIDYENLFDLEIKIEHSLRESLDNMYHSIFSRLRNSWKTISVFLLIVLSILLSTEFLHHNMLKKTVAVVHPDSSFIDTVKWNGVNFNLVKIPAGKFIMGGYEQDSKQHEVIITNDFWIGQTEVTQQLWMAVMGNNPSLHIGDNLPVDNVSWTDCQTFIKKLNQLTGRKFRLPTEAEWELAAKGGTKIIEKTNYNYSGSNQADDVAWTVNNSSQHSHAIMSKVPNVLGIYDMSGNVWEWCQDRYEEYDVTNTIDPKGGDTGNIRVRRGGSYRDNSKCCLVTFRSRNYETTRNAWQGFRLVLQINK